LGKGRAILLGRFGHDALQCFHLALGLKRIVLAVHVLIAEAAVLQAVGVVE